MKINIPFSIVIRSPLFFVYTFIFFRFLDLGTTYFNINYMGAFEANPIAAYVLTFGWELIILLVSLFCFSLMMSIYLLRQHWIKIRIFAWIFNIINLYGPVNNLVLLYNNYHLVNMNI